MARGDQLARQWMIFQRLMTSRYGKTVNDLAADLDCHPRTVYRDLDALQVGGFPIYNEKVNGTKFWALMASAKKSVPIPFSLSELIALYFGRDVLRILKNTVFHDSLESLFKKIKSTLPAESKKYLKQIEKNLRAGSGPHKKYDKLKDTIEMLNEAVINKKVIQIVYYTISRKRVTPRKVEPYKLWFYDGTFYLIGYCRSKKDIRMFAVDRIKMLNLTSERFQVPADFNVDEFMKVSFGVFQGQPVHVTVHFTSHAAGYVREKVWHKSQKISERSDGSLIMEVDVAGTQEIKHWILRWGSRAQVLEPDSLREEIRSEAAEILGVYANRSEQIESALTT
ncbi:MAG: transcriptional regulator [Desulfobacterales bacterium]|nr:transcriptional regulator [Desulfobacterales bacterium]